MEFGVKMLDCCSIIILLLIEYIHSSLQVAALEDPKRFRIEMTFSRGADLSPLEVI